MNVKDFIIYTGIILVSYVHFSDGVLCFRKLDKIKNVGSICRGIMSEDPLLHPTIEDCCDHPKGVAYSQSMITSGRRGKKYYCNACPRETVTVKNLFIPPVNVTGWSEWGSWTECSVTCGIGDHVRRRICHGGNCQGEARHLQMCSLRDNCPVDGGWGEWTRWSDCSQTCGGGFIIRTRECNAPIPQYGGNICSGRDVQMEECNTDGCPVNGHWSEWITERGCDVTCGSGTRTHHRNCDNPPPQHGGANCSGDSIKNEKCALPRCPRHGEWSFWTRWSNCSKTCGKGSRTRTRTCDAPRPKWGGDGCTGESSEEAECEEVKPCPVDGGWSNWSIWGPCFATPCSGEKGVQRKTRDCNSPLPRFGGVMCTGNHTELQDCYNNDGCPVNGGWCAWSDWSSCLQASNRKFMRRTRECKCPLPENGGTHCRDVGYESESCSYRYTIEVEEGSGQLGCYGDDEDCSPEE